MGALFVDCTKRRDGWGWLYRHRQCVLVLCLLTLSGCTTVPDDWGRSDVDRLVAERGITWVNPETTHLTSLTETPITAQTAAQIALMNNPQLQSELAQLGFAAADLYEAGRIANPLFSFSVLDSDQSGERDFKTYGLITSFTDLLTLRARTRLATAEFTAVKQDVAARVLEMAVSAQAAYYRYLAAQHIALLRSKIAQAGTLSSRLATRYHTAGNLTPRELAIEQATASEARAAELSAKAEAYQARFELANILGLSVNDDWVTESGLALPLNHDDPVPVLLQLAEHSRLDRLAAIARADLMADRLGVEGWTRWLGDLDLGEERERETDGAKLKGAVLEWEVPLFTQKRDHLMRLDAQLVQAMNDVKTLSKLIENEIYLSLAAVENAKARIAEYQDHLIPARIAAVQRAQEEENFMLIGIFELLAVKQQEYDTYEGYLDAIRDYWLARVALTRAVGNTLPSSATNSPTVSIEDVLNPQSSDHSDTHDPHSIEDSEGH